MDAVRHERPSGEEIRHERPSGEEMHGPERYISISPCVPLPAGQFRKVTISCDIVKQQSVLVTRRSMPSLEGHAELMTCISLQGYPHGNVTPMLGYFVENVGGRHCLAIVTPLY